MRAYSYLRVDPNSDVNSDFFLSAMHKLGYMIRKSRFVVEVVSSNKSVIYRDRFLNLIEYSLEEGDLLIIKALDGLGSNYREIVDMTNKIFQKKIKLICLDFSKEEICGDLKTVFLHFLKICLDFEMILTIGKNIKTNTSRKKVGRPEILTEVQKKQVIEKYKSGQSVYSLAKYFCVTRTVIQRVLDLKYNVRKNDDI